MRDAERRFFHARARASLWCAGIVAVSNGAVALLLALRASFFPPMAFMNMYVTLPLAIPPLYLLPGTFLLFWRPGTTAAEHVSRPRGRDLVAVVLALLVVLACVAVLAWLVGVAEDPQRQLLRENWLPDRNRAP